MAPARSTLIYLYRLLVASAGLILLAISSFLTPAPTLDYGALAVIAFFVAFQVNFSLELLHSEISLVHVLALGGGLLYGTATTGWGLALGITTGYLLRNVWQNSPARRAQSAHPARLEVGFVLGWNILPLVITTLSLGWLNGLPQNLSGTAEVWRSTLAASLLFGVVHSGIFLGDIRLRKARTIPNLRQGLLTLLLVEFMPPPFILLLAVAFPVLQTLSLVAIGAIPAIITVLLYGMILARSDLDRRVRELSTLDQISETLRTTLNLGELLDTIHSKVTQLMGVNNFYVALYDEQRKELWYPLAVKHGERQQWPRRPLADRLTDRVIGESEPILLARQASEQLARIGLPPSEDAPYAWIGVPLITSERTIGCLALFSISPDVEFTERDLDLLTILSGQTSVAIENALLFDQAQYRANQLETLNRLSTLITGSLDPQEVLAQICRAVTQVGDAQRSAIYLLDPEEGRVLLARAYGLSEEFVQENSIFPIVQSGRSRCLRTGQPEVIPDVAHSEITQSFAASLLRESIHAFGDFPLTTPEGHIGFLSVYFDEPHTLQAEEEELLLTFASQAALAVSNARLYARTDMALSRRVSQLSILESVSRELAAAMRSERLFEMILAYALEFTNSTWGMIGLYNEQTAQLEVRAAQGYNQDLPDVFGVDQGISGSVFHTRNTRIVNDVSGDPTYLDFTDGLAKSQLSIPLIHEERVLGVLTVENPEKDAYHPNDLSFLNQLAMQAAVAVVNAELYGETQRRLHEQSMLYQISKQLVGDLELGSVLTTIVRAVSAAGAAKANAIYIWDESSSKYHLRKIAPSENHPFKPYFAKEHLPELFDQLVNSDPVAVSPGQMGYELLTIDCPDCEQVIIPLVAARQRLGMVILHLEQGNRLNEDELQLLKAIASQGAISLQNALLFNDITNVRDRLAAVLNSVNEGIVLVENDGRIALVNETIQKFTGIPANELIGQCLDELPEQALRTFGYASLEEAGAVMKNLGQTRLAPISKSTYSLVGSKPERVLERTAGAVWSQSGRIIGWVLVLRDITEEYQVNQAREMITETLVHDLRSPMSAVMGALDVMEEVYPPDASEDEISTQAIRVARRGAKRVLGMVESLLEIARMQSGQMDLNLAAIRLRPMIVQLLVDFTTTANEFGVILRNDVPLELPTVRADQGKITRVLTNLMDNALKFTPAGGQILVTAEVLTGDEIKIQVLDSGPGVPEEYRDKIFERFTQVPGLPGRRRGSGLGLTFCRLAVEAHGGRIWVEPRDSGGSVFAFTLPISGPSATATD